MAQWGVKKFSSQNTQRFPDFHIFLNMSGFLCAKKKKKLFKLISISCMNE